MSYSTKPMTAGKNHPTSWGVDKGRKLISLLTSKESGTVPVNATVLMLYKKELFYYFFIFMSTYPTTNLMDINHIHVPIEECILHNFNVNLLQQAIVQDTN